MIGGDFGEDFYLVERTKFDGGLIDVLVKNARFSRNKIASVEKIDDHNKRSVLATVSGAGVGALLAGPIGMLVGAVIGLSPTRTVVFLVTFRDNRRILCTGTIEDFTRYLSASMDAAKQNHSAKQDWSFIENQPQSSPPPVIFCCPYCQNQFSIAGEHVGLVVVACPHCFQQLTVGHSKRRAQPVLAPTGLRLAAFLMIRTVGHKVLSVTCATCPARVVIGDFSPIRQAELSLPC